MKVKRTFSDEFKAKIIEMVAAGAATQAELSRKYGISPMMIGRYKTRCQRRQRNWIPSKKRRLSIIQ